MTKYIVGIGLTGSLVFLSFVSHLWVFTVPNLLLATALSSLISFGMIQGLQFLNLFAKPAEQKVKPPISLESSEEQQLKGIEALKRQLNDKKTPDGDKKMLAESIASMQRQLVLARLEGKVKRTGEYAKEITTQNAKDDALLKEIRRVEEQLKNKKLSAANKTKLTERLADLGKQHELIVDGICKLERLKKLHEMPNKNQRGKDAFAAAIEKMSQPSTGVANTTLLQRFSITTNKKQSAENDSNRKTSAKRRLG